MIGTLDRPVCTGVSGRERWTGDGALLGLWNTRCLRGLAGGRCLGSGRGRAAGPCRESSEDDEDDSERESTPVSKTTQAGVVVFLLFFFLETKRVTGNKNTDGNLLWKSIPASLLVICLALFKRGAFRLHKDMSCECYYPFWCRKITENTCPSYRTHYPSIQTRRLISSK